MQRLCLLWFLLHYTAFQKEDTIFFQTAAENVYFSPSSMHERQRNIKIESLALQFTPKFLITIGVEAQKVALW